MSNLIYLIYFALMMYPQRWKCAMRAKLILSLSEDDFSLDTNQPFHISTINDTLPSYKTIAA